MTKPTFGPEGPDTLNSRLFDWAAGRIEHLPSPIAQRIIGNAVLGPIVAYAVLTAAGEDVYTAVVEKAGDLIDSEPFQRARDSESLVRRTPAIAAVIVHAYASSPVDNKWNDENGTRIRPSIGVRLVDRVGVLATKGLNSIQGN